MTDVLEEVYSSFTYSLKKRNVDVKVMPLRLASQFLTGNILNQVGSLGGKQCECCLI